MSGPNPRKRPAPGASPMIPVQQMQQPFAGPAQDQMLRWNGASIDGNNMAHAGASNLHPYGMMPAQNQYTQGIPAQGVAPTSTALARRPPNQSLVPTAPRQPFDENHDLWAGFGEDGNLIQQQGGGGMDENDNIEMLEEKAQRAKREAQAKRKQIPPFVQKLSSFLEEQKNTDLIRWSEKGDSFVVLDEDEFAKTLIPELFKHNNYASFVRQLNMYGFHKRVGLSDNSMKASERKNKSPSEYYNPFFKRGHPNLLWLINKPKSGGKQKKGKKEDGDADSDEETGVEEVPAPGIGIPGTQPGRVAPGSVAGELAPPLQKKELTVVREQLSQIQSQQKTISEVIRRLRQDHQNLYQQAIMFQTMHDRHENSINAILNFLANVFRKSLEEQGGAQSVSDLLASIIPNAQMPQGSVVDLGDFIQQQAASANQMGPMGPMGPIGTPKRQQRLLPPIPPNNNASSTASPASAHSPTGYVPMPHGGQGPSGTITELFDSPSDSSSPHYMKQELRANPQEGMMKIINDTNASSNTKMNLPEMAANTSASMSNDQRQKMLNIMAGQATASGPRLPINGRSSVATPTPAPPQPSRQASAAPSSSLSPIMSSIPPPSLNHIEQNVSELDQLQRMQEEQRSAIDNLQHILGPLSPSGRIPGIDDTAHSVGNYFPGVDVGSTSGGADNYEEFFDDSAFDNDLDFSNVNFTPGATDGNDFNFSLDGAGSGSGAGAGFEHGRVIESNSTPDTPSPAPTEEVPRDDLADSPARNVKRQRQG